YSRVTYSGTTGWVASTYLGSGSGSSSSSGSSTGTSSATGTGTVIDGALNLRSGPGSSYGVILVMPGNATVTLVGLTQNSYVQVTYNGTTGWASSQYLRVGGSSSSGASTSGGSTATVIDGALNLRSSASTGAAVLLVMPGGAQVTLLGQTQNGFTQVSYNGTTGWAYSAYLQ
ncbi:MAG: SH3 domain-containing protein, partial [Thermomicrobiales bacterium]